METVKVENMELIKRMRALAFEKRMLEKEFNSKLILRNELKRKIAAEMERLKELRSLEADGDTSKHDEMTSLLLTIETGRKQLVANKEEMEEMQNLIKENEDRQLEERAEMSAHKTVLSENRKLRDAIAEEEKQKFLKEKEDYLQKELAKEKDRLKKEADAEMAKLKAKY